MKKAQANSLETLKKHTLNLLNNILPMEKNIRKAALKNSESFSKLKQLNQDINDFWIEKGLTQAEIKDSHILELCWDKLQFGSNGKYDPKIRLNEDILLIMKENFSSLRQNFDSPVQTLEFNDVPEYCYFNLANGNDLHQLLTKFAKTKTVIDYLEGKTDKLIDKDKKLGKDGISLNCFITGTYEPLPYHSISANITSGKFSIYEKDHEQARILLDIRVEPELGSLKRIIIDFIKSYIELKTENLIECKTERSAEVFKNEDALFYKHFNDPSLRNAQKLLAELQTSQFLDSDVEYKSRLDSLQKDLVSLILWDFKQTGLTDDNTIDEVLNLTQQLNLTVPELAEYEFVQDESLDKYLGKIKSELQAP